MPRLFIALDIPDETAFHLDRLAVGLPGARWTEIEDFHLTLRFIGETDRRTFDEIGEALTGVSLMPFDLQLKGLGTFPPRGSPHTLWVGVANPEPLLTLRRRIERALAECALEPERRKYAPHVTLARFRTPPPADRLGSWIARRALFACEPFPVSSFNLCSSILRASGAEHQIEATYDFVTGVMERV